MLYAVLLLLAIGLGIGAVSSTDWIIYRENLVDINHGLFRTCLDQDNENDENEISCVDLGINKNYNIYLPTVMILSSYAVMCCAQMIGAFLYFIVGTSGTKIVGFWVIGVFNILTGLVVIAACSLVITLPLRHDDAIVFARELSRILDPKKVYRKAFFIGWGSGLAIVCSGIVAISFTNRGHYRYLASSIKK